MHPRNKYNAPVDYTGLAIKYADFRKLSTLGLDGKVRIDFKCKNTLRTLTKCLLKEDFGLLVEIPEENLVPTIPLRLNYILWLEDIVSTLGFTSVKGIDIGCGASCIYSLLGAKKNNWKMIATEINPDSVLIAMKNIKENNLTNLIQIFHQKDKNMIFKNLLLNEDDKIDFCLCNPPFFQKEEITENKQLKRGGFRKPANNLRTGIDEELSCLGGELAFIEKIIKESILYKNQIKIFTTMCGHKSTLIKLQKMLRTEHITNFIQTEFIQGRTIRWGIAWTFQMNFILRRVCSGKLSIEKNFHCLIQNEMSFIDCKKKLFKALVDLEISMEIIQEELCLVNIFAKAFKNNWTKKRKFSKNINSDLKDPILVFDINLINDNNAIQLGLTYLEGESGLDGLYQIFLYFKNLLNGTK